jgi:hypothetical protein
LKMCADRLLPLSYFEKDKTGGKAGITINISGISDAKIDGSDTIDAEVQDVDYE